MYGNPSGETGRSPHHGCIPSNCWMSSQDIGKGKPWFGSISEQLAKSEVCIICVTPENLDSRWLMYEAGAIAHARIARVYYGALDPKGGAVEHGARVFDQAQCLHRPEVYAGMGSEEAAALLRDFFAARR